MEPKKKYPLTRKTTTTLDLETLTLVEIVQRAAIIKLLMEIKVILQRAKK